MSIQELQKAIESGNFREVESLCDAIKAEHGRLVIHVGPDYQADDPCGEDGWKVYSFSRKFNSYKDPEELGFYPLDEDGNDPELQAKLDSGLAFVLSYFEHGNCVWSRQGTGPQCRWDNVGIAGLLIWEGEESDLGPETLVDRAKDADSFLDIYTEWCNGNVFAWSCENDDDIWGGGNLYKLEHIVETIREQVPEGREIKFVSEIGMADEVREAYEKAVSDED